MTFLEKLHFVLIEGNRYMLLIKGLGVTLYIAFFAIIIGTILGLVVAFMRLSKIKLLRRIAGVYIDVIRGTPMMVQLLIFAQVIFVGPMVGVPREIVGIIAFGFNSGAYVAEIFRAGIQAVDIGQTEAGRSLGLSQFQTMRYIIIPQAIKNILPALGNEFIVLFKETSIVGTISVRDLTKASDNIIGRTYTAFIPLITIAIMYFVIVKILSMGLKVLERRLRESDTR